MSIPADAMPFELASMARAIRYQEWLASGVEPHMGQRVLELGSGIGTMTRWLAEKRPVIATDISEPLLSRLRAAAATWPCTPEAVCRFDPSAGGELPDEIVGVDTAVSFNVLEHIRDDGAAIAGMFRAIDTRPPGTRGRVIIFVPAHQWAYGGIDEAFDHYRRYSKRHLTRLIRMVAPDGTDIHARYFNTLGLPGWFLIGRVLRRSTFGMQSVDAMERLIPVNRRLDALLHGRRDLPLGQSLLVVAEAP